MQLDNSGFYLFHCLGMGFVADRRLIHQHFSHSVFDQLQAPGELYEEVQQNGELFFRGEASAVPSEAH